MIVVVVVDIGVVVMIYVSVIIGNETIDSVVFVVSVIVVVISLIVNVDIVFVVGMNLEFVVVCYLDCCHFIKSICVVFMIVF